MKARQKRRQRRITTANVTASPRLTSDDPLLLLQKLLDPVNAARSAAWYWYQHGCNAPADAANVVEVTRKINPALVGLDDRAMLFEKARRVLCPSKS